MHEFVDEVTILVWQECGLLNNERIKQYRAFIICIILTEHLTSGLEVR